MFESTLLRLPCAPGKFEMSWHCRQDDDDAGGPPTKVPRESIDDNPTRRHTRSSLPALDLKKCLLCDSKKNTKSYRSHEAFTRCTLESSPTILLSAARILMRISLKRRVLLEIDQHDRPSCEGSDVPCLFLQKVHQPQVPGLRCIIQRLSPMTATRHGLQMSYLNDRGVDHRCIIL